MAIASSASAQVQLPSFGGGGGHPFTTACPPLQYLRGLELRTADDVDAARPICARVGANGSASGDTPIGPWRGGNGGEVRSILCPAGRPVVVGARVGAEGRNTYIVNSIELFCARADDDKRPVWEDVGDTAFHGPSLPREAYGGGILAHFSRAAEFRMAVCPPGQLASGIHGQHGIWLDSIGFACIPGPPSSARTGNSFRRSEPAPAPRPPCVAAKAARQSAAFQQNSVAMARLTQRCLASIPNGDPGRCGQAKREQGTPRFAALYKLCLDGQSDS